MQLNLRLCVKDYIKSIPNPKPNPNIKMKPTPTLKPNPNCNRVDNQLNITRKFVNNLNIRRLSTGDQHMAL